MLRLSASLILFTTLLRLAHGEFADQLCNSATSTVPAPDQALCDLKGYGPCIADSRTGDYYCGWKGAACADTNGTMYTSPKSACDMGQCVSGVCSGSYGDSCNFSANTGCLGWLYCGADSACGGNVAMCLGHDMCQSGYCDPNKVQLDAEGRTYGTCSDPAGQILLPPTQSQRARRRQLERPRFDSWI